MPSKRGLDDRRKKVTGLNPSLYSCKANGVWNTLRKTRQAVYTHPQDGGGKVSSVIMPETDRAPCRQNEPTELTISGLQKFNMTFSTDISWLFTVSCLHALARSLSQLQLIRLQFKTGVMHRLRKSLLKGKQKLQKKLSLKGFSAKRGVLLFVWSYGGWRNQNRQLGPALRGRVGDGLSMSELSPVAVWRNERVCVSPLTHACLWDAGIHAFLLLNPTTCLPSLNTR